MATSITVTTPLPPAALAFSPLNPSHLLVGTYHLCQTTQRKSGALSVHQLPDLTTAATVATPALLDLKFSPHDPSLLAAAAHDGRIFLFRVSGDGGVGLKQEAVFKLADEDVILSVNFSPAQQQPGLLAYTTSASAIGVVDIAAGGTVLRRWQPHALEAWTCEFSQDGRRLWSGGDDALLALSEVDSGRVVWCDRRTHGAGVTAVLDEAAEGRAWTGSYDEELRLWDVRGVGAGGKGRVVEGIGLGGGVWRVQRKDERSLLASCMHAGPRVVCDRGDDGGLRVLKEWPVMNLNYASCVHKDRPGTMAWCSFYDQTLTVEELEI